MMKAYLYNRGRRAFTLAELTVVIALFGLFSTTALASLNLTMRHWKTMSAQTDVYTNCRNVINTVSKELRQSIPCRANNYLTYYYESERNPTSDLTAVLVPNLRNQTTNSITFSEANPNNFDPIATSGFNEGNVEHYRFVRYYLDSNRLMREVKIFNASNSLISNTESVVAKGENLSFRVTCLSADTYLIEFSCQKAYHNEIKKASLSTHVIVLGA